MTYIERMRSDIASEVETICFVLDEILDNIDRVNSRNADAVSERLYFSKLDANRALTLLYGDENQ